MSTYVLGIYNAHNATATLVKDGEVIACVSEERFTKVKNQYGFPSNAIEYCVKTAGIKTSEIKLVTIPFKYGAPQHSLRENDKDIKLSAALYLYKGVAVIRKIWGELAYRFPELMPVGKFSFRIASILFEKYHMAGERKYIADYLGISEDKVITFDHHLTHAFGAYHLSPFNGKKALVMTLDGEGDFKCATVSIYGNGKHKVLAETDREHSIGYVYQKLTKVMGMKTNEHEYKVMGLAPYAKGKEIEKAYKIVKDIVFPDPNNPLKFNSKFNLLDSDKFIERELRYVRFDVRAAAFQQLVEEKVVEWIRNAIKKTKINRVVLSGGVFMNIKANQKIAEMEEVKELFIMPSCGDESAPLGACLLGFKKLGESEKLQNAKLSNLYLGPNFTNEDVERMIKSKRLRSKYNVAKPRDIEKKVASLLANGEIVARMAGRMEFGARALGNRSILANASYSDVIPEINDLIKGRDFWMPFAPVILWERMNEYIDNPKKLESPFMMIGFESTKKAKHDIAAGLHPHDKTARPQILKEDANPRYYKILKEYEKLTGFGGMLNTSFNLHGYPIVLGPEESLHTFENSGLRHLALEDYLISKKDK